MQVWLNRDENWHDVRKFGKIQNWFWSWRSFLLRCHLDLLWFTHPSIRPSVIVSVYIFVLSFYPAIKYNFIKWCLQCPFFLRAILNVIMGRYIKKIGVSPCLPHCTQTPHSVILFLWYIPTWPHTSFHLEVSCMRLLFQANC